MAFLLIVVKSFCKDYYKDCWLQGVYYKVSITMLLLSLLQSLYITKIFTNVLLQMLHYKCFIINTFCYYYKFLLKK